MQHDMSKDAYSIPMKADALSSSVEIFTIELNEASGGGILALNWGTTKLSTEFKFAQ